MTALADKVLVLNKSWHPINVTTVREALTQVYTGDARIVGPDYQTFEFESWRDAADYAKEITKYIHGASWKILVPEIIVLNDYTGINKRQVKFSRRNIFERDDYTCQYCRNRFKRQDLTIDHVLPKSRGGTSRWENVALACLSCNSKKDDHTPKEAGMMLRKRPKQPRWEDIKLKGLVGPMPSSWEDFLGEMYWHTKLEP